MASISLLLVSLILSVRYFGLGSANEGSTDKVDVTVKLPLGSVVGSKLLPSIVDKYKDKVKPVSQFLGVPYAQPPIGDLRFKKPEPVKKWDKPLEAKKFRDACMQNETMYGLPLMLGSKISEDCLHVNIWTPNVPTDPDKETLKPVLVFVHGGGLILGTASQAVYHGHVFAGTQDVVVVTSNYRLGAFGFLNSASGKQAPGNMGIWDGVEVLKFVHQNIKYFGGDPKKVTFAGISAGACIVSMVAHSEKADDLFDKMIVMSSSAFIPSSSSNLPSDKAKYLAELLKCPTDDEDKMMDCLEQVKAEDLVLQDVEIIKKFPYQEMIGVGQVIFDPVIDGDLIKKGVLATAREDKGTDVYTRKKVISGTTNWEGGILKVLQGESQMVERVFKNPSFEEGVKDWLMEDFNMTKDNAKNAFDVYIKENKDDERTMLYTMVGDARLACPNIYTSQDFSKNLELYRYVFSFKPENNDLINMACPNPKSVCHGADITYTFGNALLKDTDNPDFDDDDWDQSWQAMDMFGKFIRGDPLKFKRKGDKEVDWPLYRESSDWQSVVMDVNEDNPIVAKYRLHYCKVWKKYIGL